MEKIKQNTNWSPLGKPVACYGDGCYDSNIFKRGSSCTG